MDFAAVIPAYNEARTIRDIAARTRAQVARVIVVDDGSSDGSAAELADSDVELVRNSRNFGKSRALWRGIDIALAHPVQGVVTLDGDGQHCPEDISRLLQATKHYPNHIVIGSRLHNRAAIPAARYLANRFANFWVAWAAGYPIMDSQSGMRVYPAALLRALPASLRSADSFVFESEVLIEAANLGVQSVFVPIAAVYQAGSRPSHFKLRDILRITKMIAPRLLRRGLYPAGLLASLRDSPVRFEDAHLGTPTDYG